MRVAMTLLARDEADVVDAWLRYHLARGVDLVLATDHRSCDGTSQILHEHARGGRVVVFREEAEELRQDEWTTRMSRLAATQYGAEWVIPERRRRVLVAPRGHVRGGARGCPPSLRCRPRAHAPFRAASRQQVAVRAARFPCACLDRSREPVPRPGQGHPSGCPRRAARLRQPRRRGARPPRRARLVPLRGAAFPSGSVAQLQAKFVDRPSLGQHITRARELLLADGLDRFLAETLVDDEAAEFGVRDGSLVRDTRLRNALRALDRTGSLPDPSPPTLAQDADLVLDASVTLDLDSAVLADRRCSELEHAVAVLEARGSLARRLARRARRQRRSLS